MSAFRRAREDEAKGDLGSARRRLASYLASVGYSPEVCERLARLSVRMSDPIEAGKWYFLCDSRDPEAGAAIERFRAAFGGQLRQMHAQLPLRVRLADRRVFPAAVRERMNTLGPPPSQPITPRRAGRMNWLGALLAGAGVILFLVSTVVGFFVIIRTAIDAIW